MQLPGREQRIGERPFVHIDPLAETLEKVIEPFIDDRSYAFFGHSMGGLISYVLTNRLRNSGKKLPCHIFVSGVVAPDVMAYTPGKRNLSDEQILEEVNAMGGTARAVLDSPQLLQLMIPILRADFSVFHSFRYSPMPCLEIPITALVGQAEAQRYPQNAFESWKNATAGPFELLVLPGGHFYLQDNPQVVIKEVENRLNAYALVG